MDSKQLKTEVLKYWRFTRQGYLLCATEVNTYWGIADVMVANDKEIIEIETKISFKDFLKDFTKVKFQGPDNNPFYRIDANRLFYCVTAEIKDKCISYLLENDYPFGLFSFNGSLVMVRSCRKLKDMDVKYTKKIREKILQRATSELVQLREEK